MVLEKFLGGPHPDAQTTGKRETQWNWLGIKKPQSQPSVTYFQKTLLQQSHTSKSQSSNNEQVMRYMCLLAGVSLFKPQVSLFSWPVLF